MDQRNLPHIFGITAQLTEGETAKDQSSKTIERICRESPSRLTHAQDTQNDPQKVSNKWIGRAFLILDNELSMILKISV
jgi:hypothetical protein